MNSPLDALLQAAHGHAGFPAMIQHGPGPMMGEEQEPQEQEQPEPETRPSDVRVAEQIAQEIHDAVAAAGDPDLRVALATALAAMHKYLAQEQREQHNAMNGKFSAKQMMRSYGR